VEYHGLESGYEREIFQRVQLGMTLTAAGQLITRHYITSGYNSKLRFRKVAGDIIPMGGVCFKLFRFLSSTQLFLPAGSRS
jgi:hypothetical protein